MTVRIITGDCREVLKTLESESVHCCVTSPPYFGLRDYGNAAQIGLEPTPVKFVAELVEVFRQVRRILREDGTLWLNLGDSYSAGGRGGGAPGSKQETNAGALLSSKTTPGFGPKQLLGIPWHVAFALQADGWYLRQDIIWSKPNPMPESVTDRCTKAHEYLFLLSKSPQYHYDQAAIAEPAIYAGLTGQDESGYKDAQLYGGKHQKPEKISARDTFKRANSKRAAVIPGQSVGTHRPDRKDSQPDGTRNKRSVWSVPTAPYAEAHFATFPPALIEPCIMAGCPDGGTVLDPFGGAGTTGLVADRLGRDAVLIELNPEYVALAERRMRQDGGMFYNLAAQ